MKKRIAYHFLFWISYVIWGTYMAGSYDGNYNRALMGDLLHLPLKIATTYFILYYLLPHYIKQKKYGQLIFLCSLLVITVAFVYRFIIYLFIQPYYYPESEFHFWNPPKFLSGIFDVFSVAAVAVCIRLFRIRNESDRREQELEKEKLKAELSFLKAQINPHFLFNTLNNIYGLALKNSPHTAESVLKLSSLLQFIVHDGASEKIRISEEVALINNYIELEKLRYGTRLNLTFETDIDRENEMIAPMILLSFVENSFKHGPGESRHESYIHIKLNLSEGRLDFNVTNSREGESGDETGIGLKNTKRQLELIYNSAHELEINDDPEKYAVHLKINLKKHAKAELLNR
jgi:two-component system, LytTR family, sensor kinase